MEKTYLHLGCGKALLKGWINIDKVKAHGIDVVHDLNKYPYPFKDNSVDKIKAFHVLEHLDELEKSLEEMYRILKKGGTLHIKVPHFTAPGAFLEQHRRFFWYYCFTSKRLFYKNNLESHSLYDKFEEVFRRLRFEKVLFYNHLIEPIINIKYLPQIYEHTFLRALFPAKEVEVILRKR